MNRQARLNEALPSQGDTINELFAQHYRASLRIANRILRSKEDAEDAVQTAYCAAFRNLHQFRGESGFKTWTTRIVVNCCLMHLRERRARPQLAIDELLPILESNAETPETLCYLEELQAAHKGAASGLPSLLHDVYAKSVLAGIELPTVADQLGLTASAMKSRLFRARRRIGRALQPVIRRRAA